GPDGGGETARGALPASEAPEVTLDARTVLLAAADRSAGQPAEAGAYWHSVRLSRNYLRVGSAKDAYTVYMERRDEGWTPSEPGREQWGREQHLGARPATATDEAAWRRAGSPTEFTAQVPMSSAKGAKGRPPKTIHFTTAGGAARLSHAPLVDGDKVFWLGRNVTMKDLRGLPTDPKRLKAWLLESYAGHSTESTGDKMSSDRWLFTVATGLIMDMPITPKVRAAAFRMLADLTSVKAVGTIKDAQGRAGAAVAIVEKTPSGAVLQYRLIIDDATGRALGQDIVILKAAASGGLPSGSTISSTTIVTDEWVASPPR
ncbi:MAG: CU044_5270 family protein, partial [Actinomadura sp.]